MGKNHATAGQIIRYPTYAESYRRAVVLTTINFKYSHAQGARWMRRFLC